MKLWKKILILHAVLLVYVLSGICSKYASALEFFTLKWFGVYALQIMFLGIYAILWQQILKMLPLNLSFANKSVTLVWSMLFGIILFDETVSALNIVGAAIVLAGVVVMVLGDKKNSSSAPDADLTHSEDNEKKGVDGNDA